MEVRYVVLAMPKYTLERRIGSVSVARDEGLLTVTTHDPIIKAWKMAATVVIMSVGASPICICERTGQHSATEKEERRGEANLEAPNAGEPDLHPVGGRAIRCRSVKKAQSTRDVRVRDKVL
jgi:hypothetical protein